MHPPSSVSTTRRAWVCFASCSIAMALIGAVSIGLGCPLLFPAIGASAFLVFHAPRSPFSSPRNLLLGHLIGASVGWAACAAFAVGVHTPWLADPQPWRAVGAATLALGVTSATMTLTRTAHPPAGATTLIFATGLMGGASEWLAVAGAGALLVGYAHGAHALVRESYPVWSIGD